MADFTLSVANAGDSRTDKILLTNFLVIQPTKLLSQRIHSLVSAESSDAEVFGQE